MIPTVGRSADIHRGAEYTADSSVRFPTDVLGSAPGTGVFLLWSLVLSVHEVGQTYGRFQERAAVGISVGSYLVHIESGNVLTDVAFAENSSTSETRYSRGAAPCDGIEPVMLERNFRWRVKCCQWR